MSRNKCFSCNEARHIPTQYRIEEIKSVEYFSQALVNLTSEVDLSRNLALFFLQFTRIPLVTSDLILQYLNEENVYLIILKDNHTNQCDLDCTTDHYYVFCSLKCFEKGKKFIYSWKNQVRTKSRLYWWCCV